ncbi:MAG: NBR1-Ig-like domain-containing protein [Chloroflexota bacterium]
MKKTVLAFVVLALAAISCDPTAPQSLPTQVPGAVETIIVLTANAANAMTQAVMPTATETPVGAPTSTDTPLPPTASPTATPTFFYSLPTPTNTLKIVFTPGGGGGGGSDTPKGACQQKGQSPANGTKVKASKKFNVTWAIQNTSNFDWGETDYDLVFVEGDPIYTRKIYDLPETVKSGSIVSLTVTLDAPNKPGHYKTVWRLRGDNLSCYMDITVQVVK